MSDCSCRCGRLAFDDREPRSAPHAGRTASAGARRAARASWTARLDGYDRSRDAPVVRETLVRSVEVTAPRRRTRIWVRPPVPLRRSVCRRSAAATSTSMDPSRTSRTVADGSSVSRNHRHRLARTRPGGSAHGPEALRRVVSQARWAFPDVWKAFAGSRRTAPAVLGRWPHLEALARARVSSITEVVAAHTRGVDAILTVRESLRLGGARTGSPG